MRNHRRAIMAILSAAFLVAAFVGPAGAHARKANGKRVSKKHARMHRQASERTTLAPSGAVAKGQGSLQMFEAVLTAEQIQDLSAGGYDITIEGANVDGIEVALVLAPAERDYLTKQGFPLSVARNGKGQTARQAAVQQAEDGFDVYRSWDEPGGIEDELRQIARKNRAITRLYDLGETHEGRDILALRVTEGIRDVPVGSRPAVLYQGTTHAREWISTEVSRRLMHHLVDGFKGNQTVRDILETTELWFIPVVNPDGYQYTFDAERLWRKNLNDNDGDGNIDNNDGVDLNRNYGEHWNYDIEGSSSQFSSETYRGSAPFSEPESSAGETLFDMVDFKFAVSYHSYGPLLLYTTGWQVQTPSADDPIYMALTGDDDHPAVPGFNPGVGADLYTTNGEFTDWAHGERGTLAWTPELEEGCPGCGFVFPDNEALVQEQFEKNLDFALNIAESAGDPDDPESHWGIDTQGLYVNEASLDGFKTNWPTSDLRVEVSYGGGSTQPVEVLAKRALGAVDLHYSINGGPPVTVPDIGETPDGEVFGVNDGYSTYYHYLQGEIPVSQGGSVEYWFTGGGQSTDPTTFQVVEDADADVLILAAEDYTGASPPQAPGPHYLSYFQNAITASGRTFDVYDVDANNRTAPDPLGVLSHYDAVVWYTGDDVVLREPGRTPGNASRLSIDLMLAVRRYLNDGGTLLYNGQLAGAAENGALGTQFYDPVANEQCVVDGALVLARCLPLNSPGGNDFLQYYLGAYIFNIDAGLDDKGRPFPITGTGDIYGGMDWTLNRGTGAHNQFDANSFLTTSGLLDPSVYPQFASEAEANYVRPGGPFDPHTGEFYVYSQIGDQSYKRLTRTIDVPAGGGTLDFWTSFNTEEHWDFVIVEAHTPGSDADWTTLPDINGHTSQDTGDSCPAGWHSSPDEIHPFLTHYQTLNADGTCSPTGDTGAWNATSGNSGGWQNWSVDLSEWAGGQAEVSISYVSDWAFQGLGMFIDDITTPTGAGDTSFEEDADPMDGWQVTGPPAGSADNPNNFERSTAAGFPEGAVVSTDDTLYFGFGFEGISDAADRNAVMDASLDHLLGP
ncbi:MAG: M14 family zinc carboxypeptidase [Actinomycetota bacterium]